MNVHGINSPSALASKLGIRRQDLEARFKKTRFTPEMLVSIAKYFGVSLNYLYGLEMVFFYICIILSNDIRESPNYS